MSDERSLTPQERWTRERETIRQSAIDGTHRFVWLDLNAAMRTNEALPDGRFRWSPDMFRFFVPEEVSPLLAMEIPQDFKPLDETPLLHWTCNFWDLGNR